MRVDSSFSVYLADILRSPEKLCSSTRRIPRTTNGRRRGTRRSRKRCLRRGLRRGRTTSVVGFQSADVYPCIPQIALPWISTKVGGPQLGSMPLVLISLLPLRISWLHWRTRRLRWWQARPASSNEAVSYRYLSRRYILPPGVSK